MISALIKMQTLLMISMVEGAKSQIKRDWMKKVGREGGPGAIYAYYDHHLHIFIIHDIGKTQLNER